MQVEENKEIGYGEFRLRELVGRSLSQEENLLGTVCACSCDPECPSRTFCAGYVKSYGDKHAPSLIRSY